MGDAGIRDPGDDRVEAARADDAVAVHARRVSNPLQPHRAGQPRYEPMHDHGGPFREAGPRALVRQSPRRKRPGRRPVAEGPGAGRSL